MLTFASVQTTLRRRPLIRLVCFLLALGLAIAPLLALKSQLWQLAAGTLVFLCLAWLWERAFEPDGPGTYGFEISIAALGQWVLGLCAGLLAVGAVFAAGSALEIIGPVEVQTDLDLAVFAVPLITALLVGIWEEGLFRGVVLQNMLESTGRANRTYLGVAIALFASSTLFACAHSLTSNFSLAAFVFFIANGIVWGIAALATGRVAFAAGMHSAWNFGQLKIFGFAMSGNASSSSLITHQIEGPRWLTGGAYGPEAGLIGGIGLLVMLATALVLGGRNWLARARTG